jgi:hypothetical protein
MNTVLAWLAQDPPPPSQGPEFGGSSPIGLVVTLVLLIALVFLIRSMNGHLRKLPKSFDEPAQPTEQHSTDQAPSSAVENADTDSAEHPNGSATRQ